MKASSQFLHFLGVGTATTAIHYTSLVAMVQAAGLDAVLSSTLSFAGSALLNYLLNRRFTFDSKRSHRHTAFRFALVAGAGLTLNAATMWALLQVPGMHYLIAQVFATGITLFWNFTLNRHWTFGASGPQAQLKRGAS